VREGLSGPNQTLMPVFLTMDNPPASPTSASVGAPTEPALVTGPSWPGRRWPAAAAAAAPPPAVGARAVFAPPARRPPRPRGGGRAGPPGRGGHRRDGLAAAQAREQPAGGGRSLPGPRQQGQALDRGPRPLPRPRRALPGGGPPRRGGATVRRPGEGPEP